jgi:hypothetical protein
MPRGKRLLWRGVPSIRKSESCEEEDTACFRIRVRVLVNLLRSYWQLQLLLALCVLQLFLIIT